MLIQTKIMKHTSGETRRRTKRILGCMLTQISEVIVKAWDDGHEVEVADDVKDLSLA